MKEKKLAASTIKTDLTAIRFYHDQMPYTRHVLPQNNDLNINKRKFGGVDRTWSATEVNRAIAICWKLNQDNYASIICIGYYAALRIEECFKIDTAQAEKAIKTGILTVKGKGGLIREVPIVDSVKTELRKMLDITPRGQKLFVAPGDKTHLAKKRLQSFIYDHRKSIQDKDSTRPLTFHGLRHTCAAYWYKTLKGKNYSEYEARKQVSEWLGHHRDDVTRIYLSSLKEKDDI